MADSLISTGSQMFWSISKFGYKNNADKPLLSRIQLTKKDWQRTQFLNIVHLTLQPNRTRGTNLFIWLHAKDGRFSYTCSQLTVRSCFASRLLFRSSTTAAHKILRNTIATNMIKIFPAERHKCISRKGGGRSCVTLWTMMHVGGSIAQKQPTNSSLYKYTYFLLGNPRRLVKSRVEKGKTTSPPIMDPARK